jgi:hypothetical protein
MVDGPGSLTKDLAFNLPAFETFLGIRAEVEGSWGGVAPSPTGFYDLTFYERALSKLGH